jgi:hypothetical protein
VHGQVAGPGGRGPAEVAEPDLGQRPQAGLDRGRDRWPGSTSHGGLGEGARADLYADLLELARRHDSSTNATLRIRAAYLETLATR